MSVVGRPVTRRASAVRRAAHGEDLVTTGTGVWLVVALFADGWAHLNVARLDTFFTPWHAALYSGFLASALWMAALAVRSGAAPADLVRAPVTSARALPAGYPLAAVGVVVFGGGGLFDLAWHSLFGIEQGVDALLSPSHLTLFLGAALLLSAPVRSAWLSAEPPSSGFRARLPELLSLTLTTGLVAFFLMYESAFLRPGVDEPFVRVPEGAPGHEAAQLAGAMTVGSYLITTALVVVPLLLLARRGTMPPGATTLLLGTVVWLSAGLTDFEEAAPAVAVTVAAGLVDLLIHRLGSGWRWAPRLRLPLVGGLVPAVIWPAQLAAVALIQGIRYPVALWTGAVVLSVLVGVVLGLLARPFGASAVGADPSR